jgi:hypothetical protein
VNSTVTILDSLMRVNGEPSGGAPKDSKGVDAYGVKRDREKHQTARMALLLYRRPLVNDGDD